MPEVRGHNGYLLGFASDQLNGRMRNYGNIARRPYNGNNTLDDRSETFELNRSKYLFP
ncbi:MAG: hypothetical protein ACK2U3_03715 [Anaerolineales bacterium]